VNAQKSHSQEMQRDLPCVWMMADVLKFMLCDRDYDCENCPLYHALRGKSDLPVEAAQMTDNAILGLSQQTPKAQQGTEAQINTYLSQVITGSTLYLDRCYSPNHFWMYPTKNGEIVVGLDNNILRLLAPVQKIVPPDMDTNLKKNQLCGWLIREDLTIPLHSPLPGRVTKVNPEFDSLLRTENHLPEDSNWLFQMELQRGEVQSIDDLCRGEEMLLWYVRKIQMIKQHIREALDESGHTDIGITLADGGEPQKDLEILLGKERFQDLVSALFHS